MKTHLLNFPQKHISGKVVLPGSKSILNRMLILAELAGVKLDLDFSGQAEDVRRLWSLTRIIRERSGRNADEEIVLDCGNAGTVLRFLTALCTIRAGNWLLTGTARMKERPVAALVEVLNRGGADIQYSEKQGFPPLQIKGKKKDDATGFRGGNLGNIPGNISSQFISSVLMTGAFTPKGIRIEIEGQLVSEPYLVMTLKLMESIGIITKEPVDSAGNSGHIYHIAGGQQVDKAKLLHLSYEKDWSSASYFYEMAAFSESCNIFMEGLQQKSLQGDSIVSEIYRQFGVNTTFTESGAILTKSAIPAMPEIFRFDFSNYPDLALTCAVSCAGLGIAAHLTGLKSLVIKESDRLRALVTELSRCGCHAIATGDELFIPEGGSYRLQPSTIKTYNDHRIAMAFAPLALITGEIRIEDPEVVNKSFPGFWVALEHLFHG